jgi:predicted transcriptional regulator
MYDVQISESTYEQAQRAAQLRHISLDAFVEEAVQLRLQDATLRLTHEQLAVVRAAQEDVNAGRVFTPDESKADLEDHRKQWRAAQHR